MAALRFRHWSTARKRYTKVSGFKYSPILVEIRVQVII